VKVAKRLDASNDYTNKVWSLVQPYVVRSESLINNPSLVIRGHCLQSHIGGGASLVSTVDDSALRDVALRRIKTKLNSHYGRVDAVVPVVELHDLRRTIVGIARLSTELLHSLSAIRKTKGASAIKYASKAWLTFSFGVKPLVQDVASIALAIQDYLSRFDHTMRITGSASKDWTSGLKESGQASTYGVSLKTSTYAHHRLSYKYIGGFDILVRAANNYSLDSHLGLEFDSLPGVAWELIPYSWVVDYFTTVGAFLDDTFVVPPGSTKYLLLDRLYTMYSQVIPSLAPLFPEATIISEKVRPGFMEYREFSRQRLVGLPRIGLSFKSQDSQAGHAVNKLLNLASVFISGFKPR